MHLQIFLKYFSNKHLLNSIALMPWRSDQSNCSLICFRDLSLAKTMCRTCSFGANTRFEEGRLPSTAAHTTPMRSCVLFHGAPRSALSSIVREGFDCKISNPEYQSGSGLCFAETARYSHSYSAHANPTAFVGAGSSGNEILSGEGPFAILLCRVALG